MIDLQPITTGDLIAIAQCAVIWHGFYNMRAEIGQWEKGLDAIIAQGEEGREVLRKTMQSLDKTMASLDKH
ncbi:MAG: hypothetical protein OXL41_07755 [Nitrospinae bacterium]|nr:hypothetical protein [Nitrospinota bacterium]